MSDADKIRAKRLAKLGSGQNNTTANTSPETDAAAPTVTSPNEADSIETPAAQTAPSNPFTQLGMSTQAEAEKKTTPQIKIQPRPTSPAKRERDGSERPRSRTNEKPQESLETWQDRNLRQIFRVTLKPEEVKDAHGHPLVFLASTREDIVEGGGSPQLNVDALEGAITEAASNAAGNKPFEYLLQSFKRVSRAIRGTKYTGPDDPKHEILKETRRLCMSYCIFAVTMPEMFGEDVPSTNPLVEHLLADPDNDSGICSDFLTEASSRFEEDDSIKDAIVGAAEELRGVFQALVWHMQSLNINTTIQDSLVFAVPLNFFERFFLCFRCCLLAFSILVVWPTRTSRYRGSNFFMASTES